jgi:hypothetical protein
MEDEQVDMVGFLHIPRDVIVYHIVLIHLDGLSAIHLGCVCRRLRAIWFDLWVLKRVYLRDYGKPRMYGRAKGYQALKRKNEAKERERFYWGVWIRGRLSRRGLLQTHACVPFTRRLQEFVHKPFEKLLPLSFYDTLLKRQVMDECRAECGNDKAVHFEMEFCAGEFQHQIAAVAIHGSLYDRVADEDTPYHELHGFVMIGCCVCSVRCLLPVRMFLDAVSACEMCDDAMLSKEGVIIARRMRPSSATRYNIGCKQLVEAEFGEKPDITLTGGKERKTFKQGQQWRHSSYGDSLINRETMLDCDDWTNPKVASFEPRNRRAAALEARKKAVEELKTRSCVVCKTRKELSQFSKAQQTEQEATCKQCRK